jgi:hypothetical protein
MCSGPVCGNFLGLAATGATFSVFSFAEVNNTHSLCLIASTCISFSHCIL